VKPETNLKQQIQEIKNRRVEYQCEKCGFIDTNSKEEFASLPKEQQDYLTNHIQKCGGRFLPYVFLSEKDILALLNEAFKKCAYVDYNGKPAFLCSTCQYFHGIKNGCYWEKEKVVLDGEKKEVKSYT